MNRSSKISRLPRHLRDELNQRLETSEQNKRLLQWLNSLPEVQALLISEQLLSIRRQPDPETTAADPACLI